MKPKTPKMATPSSPCTPGKSKRKTLSSVPTQKEQSAFIETIKCIFPSSAILQVTTFKCGPKINKSVATRLPPAIVDLKKMARFKNISAKEIRVEVRAVLEHLAFSTEEAEYLAKCTVLQSKSILWFEHRKGRITSSIFGAVSRMSLEKPSRSLLDRILQVKPMPNVPALEWGRKNEEVARKAYVEMVDPNHTNFKVTQTGLHLHPAYPFLGASPDSLVECSCCGDGLLEIKCPYSKREIDNRKHDYFKQIQGQLFICNRSYCDFVCWTLKGMHIERIHKDERTFLLIAPKLRLIFFMYVLPELLGLNYANEDNEVDTNCDSEVEEGDEGIFFFCQKEAYGVMIACDNKECP